MQVVIKGIESLSHETLRSLGDNGAIIVSHRGSVIDLEIADNELARRILKERCGIDL